MDFDADLIRALQEDGRASIRSLADRLSQTRAAVAARLRVLLDDRTVRVVAAVDPVFLGQHVLAHVSIRTEGAAGVVAAPLRDMTETVFVSSVGGAHDLVTEVRLGSMAELHDLLARIRALDGVLDINTIIYSTVVKGFFVSEYHGDITLDAIDEALIEQLQIDGRKSFRALGQAVRLSPSAVATRVQRLIDGGVIKISAVEARGLAHRQLSMGVGVNLDDDTAIVQELRTGRGVDFAARTLGRFDIVATLVEPSAGALYASLERLRALPGVTRIEAWLHLAVLKEDYARTLRDPRISVEGR
ncbi:MULTISPECIES: Lrp/AsnC family transcriptional regulator [Microbacterium]|jgi:DNA-binding Lrp family transcriptional regulator|uniref:Lrp/AsnC family transcriptional regulator n=1 Tax=Microbacterium TaxID=33882 RepID=UPI000CFB810C|nr:MULTISPECIES: Lrp/AsnC family transcriptional regulator [unclassified Microbacterium]PRB04229.1 AsnC family transcriptional regulator [Microbacterium sp. MYb72]